MNNPKWKNPAEPGPEELSALLNALCDDMISPAEMERLDEMLVSDPNARRAYCEAIGLHVALRFLHKAFC